MRAPLMHLAEGGFLSSSSEGGAPQILSTEEEEYSKEKEGYSIDPLPGFNNAPGFMSTVSRLDPMINSYLQDPIPYVPYVAPVAPTPYVPSPEGGESSDPVAWYNSQTDAEASQGLDDAVSTADQAAAISQSQFGVNETFGDGTPDPEDNSISGPTADMGLGDINTDNDDPSNNTGPSDDDGNAPSDDSENEDDNTSTGEDWNEGGRIPPLYAATGSGVTQGLADSLNQTTLQSVLDSIKETVVGKGFDIFSGIPNLGSTVFGLNTGMSNKAEVDKIHELQGFKDPSFKDYFTGIVPGLEHFGVNTPQSDFKDKVYDSKIANNNIYGPPDPTITTKDIETSLGINTIPPVTIETLPPVPFEPPIITIPEVKIEQLQTESDKDKAADVAQQAANDAVNTSSGYTDTSNNYGGNDNDDGGSTPGDSSGSYGGVGDYNMGGLIPPPNIPKRKIDMKFNIMLDPLG